MRRRSIIRLAISLVAIFGLGYFSGLFHWRLDLTQDKRYTLQPFTRATLREFTSPVHLQIYLSGDLPIGFKRMQKSLDETLQEFRVIAGSNLSYDFVNPLEYGTSKQRKELLQQLKEKGIESSGVQQRDAEGGITQKVVYPGLLMSCGKNEVAVNLLHNNPALSGDENVNLSIQNFEFVLIDALMRLTATSLPKLAFIHGHGELDELQTGDIERALLNYYDVYRIAINGDMEALKQFEAIIVAGPTKEIPEQDKIVIDQFIMRGGSVLWFVNPVAVSLDSLSAGATTLAMINQHNLDDMLFRYGVRLNSMVVQDLQCAVVPVNVAAPGQDSKFVPAPWVYYPLLSPPASSPITRNLNLILSKFISPVDTVGANPNVRKQILLTSSGSCNLFQAPLFVSLQEINRKPNEREFRYGYIPVAALLEGEFKSAFRNRPLKKYNHEKPFDFVESSAPAKMIVVADANIICNDVQRRPTGGFVLPLGYDRFTRQTYGNKELVMNMVKYLTDDSGLMELRNRDFKLRLLDRKRIASERLKWQLINMLVPSCLLVIGGVAWWIIRRRKYCR